MIHDPLCPMWSKVVAGDVCDCDLITKVREDMLAKCIAAVEEMHIHGSHPFEGIIECNCIGPRVVANLRALQEKP